MIRILGGKWIHGDAKECLNTKISIRDMFEIYKRLGRGKKKKSIQLEFEFKIKGN